MEFSNQIMLKDPNLTPLFGYWEFERYYQRFYHWSKTGIWPKKTWVRGLIEVSSG